MSALTAKATQWQYIVAAWVGSTMQPMTRQQRVRASMISQRRTHESDIVFAAAWRNPL